MAEKTVPSVFAEVVSANPDALAVISAEEKITYGELDARANCIALNLMKHGVIPGDGVAFSMKRCVNAIALMLGILKVGAIMIPIDASYPFSRIDFILDDSFAKLYVVDDFFDELLAPIDENAEDEGLSNAIATGAIPHTEEGCYCLYTSGSTGQPKGVLVPQRGILNLVLNTSVYEGFDEIFRIGFSTTFTFDVAMQETFTTLLNGRTGVILPERRNTPVDEIVHQIVSDKVDMLFSTPTYFSALTNKESNALTLLNQLKLVCLAGEKFFLNETVQHLRKDGAIRTRFDNQYGPVELSVISATRHMKDDDFTSIGSAIPNMKAYILSEDGNVCAPGVKGELVFAGKGVALGYLNHPELTETRFVENPAEPGIIYKTGDVAYFGEDGEIHYVGRNDFQVKLRGQRIELEEIESVLLKNEGVKNAAVVVQEFGGKQILCAFYETREAPASEEDFRARIHRHLKAALPIYMVPDRFYRLEALPTLTSGKVDRNTLATMKMEEAAEEKNRTFEPPANELEQTIVQLMKGVLEQESLGVDEDFFDLGADSLNIIEFVAELKGEGILVGIQDVFDARNARALGEVIEQADRSSQKKKHVSHPSSQKIIPEQASDFSSSEKDKRSASDTPLLRTATDASEDTEFATVLHEFLTENKALLENEDAPLTSNENAALSKCACAVPSDESKQKKSPVLFLTGATGFLGAHVLHELIERTSATIYCLVRATSHDEATERVRGRYSFYFNSPITIERAKDFEKSENRGIRPHVHVLHGNLEKKNFGLDEKTVKALQERIDCIINCSANVSYYGNLASFEKINTEPVKNFVRLARGSSKHIHLLHISTVSVAGSGFSEEKKEQRESGADEEKKGTQEIAAPIFTEEHFFVNQAFRSAYARSKFEAEKILLQEMIGGFDATIVRLGNLLHRTSDAQFQPNINNNSFMRHVQALAAVGIFPTSFKNLQIEMSPIDKVAEAVASLGVVHGLATEKNKARVLNLTNPDTISGSLLIEALRKHGFKMEEKSEAEFRVNLMQLQETPRLRGQAAYLLGGISEEGAYSLDPDNPTSSHATTQYMKKQGFTWNLASEKYVDDVINNLVEIGFLDPHEKGR